MINNWIFFKFLKTFLNIYKFEINTNKNVLVWKIKRKIYLEKIKNCY